MSKRMLIALIMVLAASLAVLSCGGDDGSDDSANSGEIGPLSKAEFIKLADEICTKADNTQYSQARAYRERHEAELDKLSPVAAEEKLIRLFTFPAILKQVADVRALGFPEGEEETVEKILVGFEKAVEKAEKDPYAIEGEVPSENPLRNVAYAARDYGFKDCRNPA